MMFTHYLFSLRTYYGARLTIVMTILCRFQTQAKIIARKKNLVEKLVPLILVCRKQPGLKLILIAESWRVVQTLTPVKELLPQESI
jgi:hypothetical protein